MKKLYLKNGMYLNARADQDETGRYICISEIDNPGKLSYSVFTGKSAVHQTIIFTDPMEEISFFEILTIAEIIENFNQYFNNLNQ